MPTSSAAPLDESGTDWRAVRNAGFVGLQHYFPEPAAIEAGLEMSGMARITDPEEARPIAMQHKAWGFVCSTWRVGTGFESDAEMDAPARATLDASSDSGLPVYIETHRATMTQDMRRTTDLCSRSPDLKFNADLSHWYTGAEMRYGDFEAKLAALAPVFERTRFMHGRIGHSCTMQLPLEQARDHECWEDYRAMWRLCLEGFANANENEPTVFAPETLPASVDFQGTTHRINYATLHEGEEVGDRWRDALAMLEVMDALNAEREGTRSND